MFCRNCGNELPTGAQYCNRCGTKITPITLPEPDPVPTAANDVPAGPEPAPTVWGDAFNAPAGPEPAPAAGNGVPVEPEPIPEPEPIVIPQQEPQRNARPAYTRPTPEEQNRPLFTPDAEPELPKENRPLSPWAYFGWSLLFMIPVLGLIPLIICSFAGGNVNRRNFARSFWIGIIIVLVLVLGLMVLVLTGVLRGPLDAAIAWLRSDGLTWLAKAIGV